MSKPLPEAIAILSPRERQVFKLVAAGKTSKEIADVYGVTPGTVDTYRSRMMAKLKVDNLVQLVLFAVRHGLVKVPR